MEYVKFSLDDLMNGLFITFEGIEGCGKTTQANYLYKHLLNNGADVLLTREPGGTDLGVNIRRLILDSSSIYPITELFLFLADRNQHVNEIIKPVLQRGAIVICDRYYHSTYAYQASGRNAGIDVVKKINDISIEGLKPDITFLIDIPVEIGFSRKKALNLGLDRIEREDFDFHNNIRNAYLKIAKDEKMIIVVDGMKKRNEIKDIILNHLLEKFKERINIKD